MLIPPSIDTVVCPRDQIQQLHNTDGMHADQKCKTRQREAGSKASERQEVHRQETEKAGRIIVRAGNGRQWGKGGNGKGSQ